MPVRTYTVHSTALNSRTRLGIGRMVAGQFYERMIYAQSPYEAVRAMGRLLADDQGLSGCDRAASVERFEMGHTARLTEVGVVYLSPSAQLVTRC